MPIAREGWELLVTRQSEQQRNGRTRTVGRYQVFHDGIPQAASDLSGMTAESHGPGKNRPINNGHRIEPGRYPLFTQGGEDYVTIGYRDSQDHDDTPRPGVELKSTGERTEILFHPGIGFLAAVGCINLCTSLPDADEDITYSSSRRRVISVIDNMREFCGEGFPDSNGHRIPKAFVVIDGEP